MEKWLKAKYIVVLKDGMHQILTDGFMQIVNDKIGIIAKKLPSEDIPYEDLGEATIVPGFINLHCHVDAPMSKSLLEDVGTPGFYQSNLYDESLALTYSAEEAEVIAKFTLADLLRNGCTTIVDPGNFISGQVARIAGEMGARAYIGACYRSGLWYTTDGHQVVYPYDDEKGFLQMDRQVEALLEYHDSADGRIKGILAPTQTTTCSEKLLKRTREYADRYRLPITIHAGELAVEFQECVRRYGMTPVEFLANTGLLGEDVIVGHGILISGHSSVNYPGKHDLELLSRTHTTVAHSPWVFARRGIALESFAKYRDWGINIGLGTDTFPTDYLNEMRFCLATAKLVEKDCFAVTAKDAFYAATIGGAKALMRKDIGILETGAKADFIVFDHTTPDMAPMRDPIKNIVYSARKDSIKLVFVDGREVVRDGRVAGVDERNLAKQVQRIAEKMWENIPKKDRLGRSAQQLAPYSIPFISES